MRLLTRYPRVRAHGLYLDPEVFGFARCRKGRVKISSDLNLELPQLVAKRSTVVMLAQLVRLTIGTHTMTHRLSNKSMM